MLMTAPKKQKIKTALENIQMRNERHVDEPSVDRWQKIIDETVEPVRTKTEAETRAEIEEVAYNRGYAAGLARARQQENYAKELARSDEHERRTREENSRQREAEEAGNLSLIMQNDRERQDRFGW